jgi:hypothetical protein
VLASRLYISRDTTRADLGRLSIGSPPDVIAC